MSFSALSTSLNNFTFHHRRLRRRITTFIALLTLVGISLYVLFIQQASLLSPSVNSRRPKVSPSADQIAQALETLRVNHHHKAHGKPHHSHRKQVKLDSTQELAAVSSFLASLPQNVIPSFVDPSLPLDPQLVLDFDTRGPRAGKEVLAMVEDVWIRNPVFLYSKYYSPASRDVKSILSNMNLRPAPTIIDVDTRDDAEVLQPLLTRLTRIPELPILIVGGKIVGSIEEVRALDQSGDLRKLVAASGAVIDGFRRKKHRR